MSETSTLSVYESRFAKTDKTDAVLVVEGKKLHVNKAILSYHSDYFNTLFNSDFKEKSISEIEIKDVDLWEFATLLSVVHGNTIKPPDSCVEKLLELSDRFLLPAVKPYLEQLLINSNLYPLEKILIAERHDLKDQMKTEILRFTENVSIRSIENDWYWFMLSDNTKVKILSQILR
ncbi:Protein CBG18565 [Caenorhabditis briggsae]|nr:Protein CBG18565 [Caenorhabditis briggsae]CAP35989.1 Protein CBG18565 [Caenorhabditis briggsae]